MKNVKKHLRTFASLLIADADADIARWYERSASDGGSDGFLFCVSVVLAG